MKRFSAQYVITNTGPPLRRGIVTVDSMGTITGIEDTRGELSETASVEFHNGIITPGFVNTHCHLELSHMKGTVGTGKGLTSFIGAVRNTRAALPGTIEKAIADADRAMFRSGINLCADICNTPDTFGIKQGSEISYLNLLEVFGIDPGKAGKRIKETVLLAGAAALSKLPYSIVPHSVYSVSLTLFRLLRELSAENRVTSVHFMESADEKALVEEHSGPMMNSYLEAGLISSEPETVRSHADAVLDEITPSGNLILVHNTFITRELIAKLKERDRLFYCLCPGSNRYIEERMPPAGLLREEGCSICIGTDSLASNTSLDILEELKLLQSAFPGIPATELIAWATVNGARALGMEESYGRLVPGTRPGLLLIGDADLTGMRLLQGSYARRLA